MNPLNFLRNRLLHSLPAFLTGSIGFAFGTVCLLIFARLRLALGDGIPVTIATLVTLVLSAVVSSSLFRQASRRQTGIAMLAVACWCLIQPSILERSMAAIGQFSILELTHPLKSFGVTLSIVLASLFPVSSAGYVLFDTTPDRRGSLTLGLALSLLVMPIWLSYSLPLSVASWISISALAISGVRLVLNLRPDILKTSPDNSSSVSDPAVPTTWSLRVNLFLLMATAGAWLAVAGFVNRQLVLNTLTSEFILIGGLFAGLALSGVLKRTFVPWQLWLGSSAWGATLMLAYPTLTFLSVYETTWISNSILLQSMRALLSICLALPAGYLLGQTKVVTRLTTESGLSQTIAVAVGFTVAMLSGLSIHAAVMGITLMSLSLACGTYLLSKASLDTKWYSITSLSFALALIVCGFIWSGRLDPARSEKVVFSSNAYAAMRNGLDWKLMNWIDDGRRVASASSLSGHWSLWKHRGAQAVTRQDGLVTELRTDNPAIVPAHAAEVLPGLFPLVAHTSAEHVLVLGLHSTTLRTCESFPLLSLNVVDNAPHFAQRRDWALSGLVDPDQVKLMQSDLHLALKAKHPHPYDVIVLPHTIPATVDGASQLTQDFYQGILSQLAPNGIFCQRLAFYDLGPNYVEKIVGTLRSVFPEVLIVESIPGEVLLLGADRNSSLITPELIEQFQLPQTRLALGKIGWDWSIPASRGTLDTKAVDKWLGEAKVHFSTRQPEFAFQLPQEVARWGSKSQMTRQVLAKHGMALGGYLGEGPQSLEIQQRLEDLQLAQNILENQPDNVWSYRAVLKKQLTERPRSKILQVKHEGLKRRLHPDDQRRKDYLQTLGDLAHAETPSFAMIDQLVQYLQPFDPLLGPFVSNEAVQQLRRMDAPTEAAQFHNLLFSIHFSSGADKSVRNVSEAITLLCENPEIISDNANRWDQLNGLVEVLRHRWQLRFYDRNRAQDYETIDTEQSLAALDKAIAELEENSTPAGLTSAEWDAREEMIEMSVLRPLQQHRSQQLRRQSLKPSVSR